MVKKMLLVIIFGIVLSIIGYNFYNEFILKEKSSLNSELDFGVEIGRQTDEDNLNDEDASYDSFDIENPQKFVNYNFMEINRVVKISKIRSGYGHDYSIGESEECRSMKHYFWIDGTDPGKKHNPPWMEVIYFSPVDGKIKNIRRSQNNYGNEAQFSIVSNEFPSISFLFFHVALDESFIEGSEVSGGQYIGTIGDERAHGEIGVQIGKEFNEFDRDNFESMAEEDRRKFFEGRMNDGNLRLISFIELVNDKVWSEYQEQGFNNKEEFIISKEYRDANPLNCDENTEEGRFIPNQGQSETEFRKFQSSEDNWVISKK